MRAEQRRLAIERANKVLFDATDDVKALHSKLLLSEVRKDCCHAVAVSMVCDLCLALAHSLLTRHTQTLQRSLPCWCERCPPPTLQVLAENQALIEFKQHVKGLRKEQDAVFVAQQKQALAVSSRLRVGAAGSSRTQPQLPCLTPCGLRCPRLLHRSAIQLA